jgi:hypothetical protein
MMLIRAVSLMTISAVASGCGVAAKVNARNDMEASKAAYKACLAQNATNAATCEGGSPRL